MKNTLVDANIILRILLDDHDKLAAEAKQILGQPKNSCIVSAVVLAEVVYVLRGKGYLRKNTATAVNELLEHQVFFYDEPWLEQALGMYGETGLDFADCYLLARSQRQKLSITTLEKKLKKRSLLCADD